MTWKRCGKIVSFILAFLGLATLSENLTKWREFLSFLWEQGFINWACLIIGVGGLVYPHRAKIIEWFRQDSDPGSIQSLIKLSLMLPLLFVGGFLLMLPLLFAFALLKIGLAWLRDATLSAPGVVLPFP